MTSPLLTTKLHIPPARPNLVARPRLIERLNEGLTRPLTLISAPPGFGKTTLLSTWLEQQSLPAAWYSLDERDNDLARFLAYLVAALETVQPEIGRQALNRLRSRRMPPLESVMTLLSNDIAAIPRDFILVLDDYHLVELQVIHEAMAFLLDHLPPPLHLVIASRADPPFPLTRLRARGQLVEVRGPDLRFSPDEAAAFLNQGMGLSLTVEQVAALEERAEGWIAGLQLAALSMQGRQDIAGFVEAFTGSHHFVLDYLVEEVLQRQTPEIQTFLLQTSILDQMNATLCDTVTGRNDSLQVLARLEKANLFIIPLDDARQWYRYHHLFDDLLQSRLQQSLPDQIGGLQRRASAWYEENGFPNEAVDYALAVPDFDRAVHLIEQAGLSLLLRSEDATILNWITRLPDDLVRTRPFLSLLYATALTGMGSIELASARLTQVDDAQLDPQARGLADLLRTFLAFYRTDLPHAIESMRAMQQGAKGSIAYPSDPQPEVNTVASFYLTIMLGWLQSAAGLLRDAAATCRHGLEIGKSFLSASPWALLLGFIHLQLADVLYERNEIEDAAQHAARGLEICQAGRNAEFESHALLALAQIKESQGDRAGAVELIETATHLVYKHNVSLEAVYLLARQARVLVTLNHIDDAARVVSKLPPEDQGTFEVEQPFAFIAHAVSIARARVLIAQGEFDRAAQSLDALCQRAQADAEIGTLIEALALLSLARHAQGDTAQAATALARALSLAEPEGYMRTFVDLGEPMEQLLKVYRLQVAGSSVSKEFVMKLLASFPAVNHAEQLSNFQPSNFQPPNQPSYLQPSNLEPLAEPLSERELAVLRLIAEGLPNHEIAEQLVVSVNTIKTHINNIYGKLGVGSRTAAVARAREFKLL